MPKGPLGPSSAVVVALVVMILSVWDYLQAEGPIAEFPLQDYCGVGVCPTELVNPYLPFKDPSAALSNKALSRAKAAVAADPASPYVWADLAELQEIGTDSPEASYCFRQALNLAPHNPTIQRRANAFTR